jgi:ferric-dicitrate binding protein FerR (iron transport regulator)
MSEDRLEKALEAMKNEDANPDQLEKARARVWEKLTGAGPTACSEFVPLFHDYREGKLPGQRRLLLEDHLSRCAQCRAQLSEMKGEQARAVMPRRRRSWPRWGTWAAAAAVLLATLYLGRDRIDKLLAPRGPRATIASLQGTLSRIPQGVLQAGQSFGEGETVRTGPGAHALLRLADGSEAEINERTELAINAAWSGQTIHLRQGDIILQAAKQRRGYLRVQTRDSIASVQGTIFAVSSGFSGTIVSVVEGSVAVDQPGAKVVLAAGEQAASNPGLATSVREAVSWSSHAESYWTRLPSQVAPGKKIASESAGIAQNPEVNSSLLRLEKQIAALPAQELPPQAGLIRYLPANTVLYGGIPNLSTTISQAMTLFEQESASTQVFREWWNSESGRNLKQTFDRIQSVMPLLGEEIALVIADNNGTIPAVIAEIRSGKRAELAAAMEGLRNQAGGASMIYGLTDTLMVVSDARAHLEWILGHLGQGASTAFSTVIAERYQRRADCIFALDAEAVFRQTSSEAAVTGAQQLKYLFLEQRSIQGSEQNEITLSFKGPRMGLASWLANTGSGGAAEYLSTDSVLAVYAATREPRQFLDELIAPLIGTNSSLTRNLAGAGEKLGPEFVQELTSALGAESAVGVEGLSLTGPVWVMTMLVNNPAVLDSSIRKLVDILNDQIQDPAQKIVLYGENVDGRTWTTVKSGILPVSATWTYDRGYLVAGSDRGAAARAIVNRDGSASLVRSSLFQQQFPASAGLHPSGFAWVNTKGAFQSLSALISNPILQKLAAERDPILLVFDASTEQIHAASRTRITGLLVDFTLMLNNLSGARNEPPAAMERKAGSGIR